MYAATALTPSLVVAVASAAFFVGLTKGGLSGLAPLITIIVAVTVPTTVALGILLPILMVGDVFALWAHWGRWDRALISRLLPGAALGIAVASAFLQSVSAEGLRNVLVVATLAFVVHRVAQPHLARRRLAAHRSIELRPWHGVAAGTTAGVTSTVAHLGGPPVAAYLLTERVQPRTFVATSAALFFMMNWLKVPGYLAAGLFDAELLVDLSPALLLLPPGILIGRWVVQRIDQFWFDRFILASLVVGALLLLVG